MDYKEVLDHIKGAKNAENECIEFKRSFSEWEEIARTIAAFSTHKGGKIFVGIDNKGIPVGTNCSDEIKAKLQTLSHNGIKPPATIKVETITHNRKKGEVIVCIQVQKGHGIFSYKSVNYQRRDDTNHALTPDEIFDLQRDIRKLYFDEMPSSSPERPGLISDIDERKVTKFLDEYKAEKIGKQLDLSRFLLNYSLLVDDGLKVKNAAIMLFGKKPEEFIPQNKIKLSFFPSNIITEDFMKREKTGDVKEIFEGAFFEISKNMRTYSVIKGAKRIDVTEYPSEVIRECLINAIVHRDYFGRNTEIFIKMFTDRIEVLNPATFPFENITFEEIKKQGLSKRRNPLLADFFEKMGLMEREGRGLSRIKEVLRQHGLPEPIFEVDRNTFKVTIKNSSKNPEAIYSSPFGRITDLPELNKRQIILLEMVKDPKKGVSSVNTAEYMKITHTKNAKTASRDLEDLTKKGWLKKKGKTRGVRYSINF